MSFEEVMSKVMLLGTNVDALAAVGALAGARASGTTLDPDVEAALKNVLSAAGFQAVETLEPQQLMMLAGATRSLFLQGNDILTDAARAPGWRYTDPSVLEGQGRASGVVPGIIARTHPDLANVSSFLDVGAGVGLLAVSATNVWPDASVVGIDVWEPSLERARANVGAGGLDDRITLRNQDLVALDDVDAYDCAWIPTFFLPEDVLKTGLARTLRAVRPGGWAVLGVFLTPPDPVAASTTALKTIRGGGCVLDLDRAAELLTDAGFVNVHPLERTMPMPLGFVIGQRPA